MKVKAVAIGGGFSYGALGFSHHATEDLAVLRAIPDVTVVAPGDDWETVEVTRALVDTPGTCYLRLDRSPAGDPPAAGERFTLREGRVVARGSRVAVIACGSILGQVLADAGAFPARFRRLGIANRFVSEVGSQEYLTRQVGIDAEGVARSVREMLAQAPTAQAFAPRGVGSVTEFPA